MKGYVKFAATCTFSIMGIAAAVAGVTFGVIHFKNSIGQGGVQMPSSVVVPDEFVAAEEESPDSGTDFNLSYISYRVKKGDMIGYIADEFGVTQDTIISINNIKSTRLIQIGQYLKIPSMPGILYTVRKDGETIASIAEQYNVSAEKCSFVNNLSQTDVLSAGKSLFVPDAEMDWVTKQEINGDLFKRPIQARYRLTSYFGWRQNPFNAAKRTYHNGMDMACPTGTKIYASLSGKVTQVGENRVYGKFVVIAHHSGYTTLYGHMSKHRTTVGAVVTPSTVIGEVGNTGMSTGPHLHFTVYKNGRAVNPANLWN